MEWQSDQGEPTDTPSFLQHRDLPPPPPSPTPPPNGPWSWNNCQVQHCNTSLLLGIGGSVFLAAALVQQLVAACHRRNFRLVTETVALMMLGAACQGAYLWSWMQNNDLHSATTIARDPTVHDVIYYMLLPPIIFEAGFTMRKRKFFANFASILLLAVVGTLIAILVTGGLLYAMVRAGVVATDFTFNQLLLFSSLISSTDPIATLAILKAVKAKPPLYDLIFGESALNDALSIVLFNIFKVAVRDECYGDVLRAPSEQVGRIIGQLCIVLPASILCGVAFGFLSAMLTRHMGLRARKAPQAELGLLLVCALACYGFVDSVTVYNAIGPVQLSAIMALFFCGIVMRHYTYHNLSDSAKRASVVLFQTLSSVAEAGLALLLGSAIVDYVPQQWQWDWSFIGCAIVATLVARATNILPMAALANQMRPRSARISGAMQGVMWWSGLRGGVSFALAMTLDDSRSGGLGELLRKSIKTRLVTCTLACIVFTNVVMAPLTGPIIAYLGVGGGGRKQRPTSPGTPGSGRRRRASSSSSSCSRRSSKADTAADDDYSLAPHPSPHHRLSLQQPPGPYTPSVAWSRLTDGPVVGGIHGGACGGGGGGGALPNGTLDAPSGDVAVAVAASPSDMQLCESPCSPRSPVGGAGANASTQAQRDADDAADDADDDADVEAATLATNPEEEAPPLLTSSGLIANLSSLHRGWRTIDETYLKPIFGGHQRGDPHEVDDEDDDEED